MAIETAAVTVATTATALAAGGGGSTSRTIITVKPAAAGSAEVYVGPVGVTVATGLPLGGGISFDLTAGEALYGIVATGTVAVRVMEHGI
jgi:hypothetical protein